MNGRYQDTIEYWKILSVFNAVDPINILPNDNRQEYDSEVCILLDYFEKKKDIKMQDLENRLKEIFAKMFSLEISESDLYFLTTKISYFIMK